MGAPGSVVLSFRRLQPALSEKSAFCRASSRGFDVKLHFICISFSVLLTSSAVSADFVRWLRLPEPALQLVYMQPTVGHAEAI